MFLLNQIKKHKAGRVAINVAGDIIDVGRVVVSKTPEKDIMRLRTKKRVQKQQYILIYHIKFQDGAEYVGQTKCSLKKRLWYHLNKPCNKGVQKRLAANMPYQIRTVSRHTTGSRANQAEINLIWEREKSNHCKRLLNRRGSDMVPAPDFSH